MDIGVLEGLNQTQCLINAAANWQIVYGDLTQFLIAIDDEQATEWNARLLIQHAVVTGDLLRFVSQQWNIQTAQTTLLAWRIDPGQVAEVAVGRAGNQLATDFTEFSNTIGERNDLGWTNEGEVQWIEEEHQVFAFVLAQIDFFEFTVNDGGAGKSWSWFIDGWHFYSRI